MSSLCVTFLYLHRVNKEFSAKNTKSIGCIFPQGLFTLSTRSVFFWQTCGECSNEFDAPLIASEKAAFWTAASVVVWKLLLCWERTAHICDTEDVAKKFRFRHLLVLNNTKTSILQHCLPPPPKLTFDAIRTTLFQLISSCASCFEEAAFNYR